MYLPVTAAVVQKSRDPESYGSKDTHYCHFLEFWLNTVEGQSQSSWGKKWGREEGRKALLLARRSEDLSSFEGLEG